MPQPRLVGLFAKTAASAPGIRIVGKSLMPASFITICHPTEDAF